MSSKTQYKDALKRANRINSELKRENQILRSELEYAQKYPNNLPKYLSKKWWQFWR